MFCLSCGKKITENSKFCKYCGTSQSETKEKNKKKVNKKNYEVVWSCDFCDKEFSSKELSDKHQLKCIKNPKNKKFPLVTNPKRAWFYLWIVTVITFIVTLIIWSKYSEFNIDFFSNKITTSLFFANICLGVFAFLAMIPDYKQKKNQVSSLTKYSLITCLIYLSINLSIFAIEGSKAKNNDDYRKKYYVAITPTPLPTPVLVSLTPTIKPKNKTTTTTTTNKNNNTGGNIDCVGPDGVHFKTTKTECEKFNSDWGYKMPTPTLNPYEWIKCPISANCGGGYKDMTRSECQKMTCCQINNTWELRDKGQCNTEQERESNAEWADFCNGLYNPDKCSDYWDPGTSGLFNCQSDAYSNRINCYNRQH